VLTLLGAIPYTTFPLIEIGPLHLRTFGLVVAVGVLIGAWLAARYAEEYGVPRDTTYSLAMRMVLAGVIGSRITWVLTHLDEVGSLTDAVAIWQGGLQFSGGFVFAVIAGYPVYRHWNRLTRWHSLDGYAYGLAIGLAIGRIGCIAVGEHFGRLSSFFLAVRYDGGSVREPTLGDLPLEKGMVFHQTAVYELLYLLVLFVFLTWLMYGRRHRPQPGTVMAIFCAYYGVMRFISDSLRVNDERIAGLTGAQFLCLALLPTALWVWFRVRKQLQTDVADGMVSGLDPVLPPVDDLGEDEGEDDGEEGESTGSTGDATDAPNGVETT
jgi:phosphatidylglycerol:prolipoprotein diacylglycerol transferase